MRQSSMCSALDPLAYERRLPDAYSSRDDRNHCPWASKVSMLPSRLTYPPQDVLYYNPSCHEISLTNEVGAIISALHLGFSWTSLIPSRVGWDAAVDASVRALCDIINYCTLPLSSRNASAEDRIACSYGQAIRCLQQKLQNAATALSDQTMLAICVLSLVDFVRAETLQSGTGDEVCAQHHKAVQTILLQRPRTDHHSELTRALVNMVWVRGFHVPIASGLPSPFEDKYWHTIEPLRHIPPKLLSLQKLYMQIFSALSRLITNMRSLREAGTETSSETVADVISHAQQLLDLADEEAESFALHKINVVKNDYPEDRDVVPYCMIFPDLDSLLTVLPYWHARLQVLRTCRYLENILDVKFDGYSREAESRTLKNILMCWPRILGVPGNIGNGSGGIIMQSAVFIWCSLSDDKDTRSDCIRDWIMKKLHGPGISSQLTSANLDAAADVLLGDSIEDRRYEAVVPIPHPGAPITTLVGTFLQRVRG